MASVSEDYRFIADLEPNWRFRIFTAGTSATTILWRTGCICWRIQFCRRGTGSQGDL